MPFYINYMETVPHQMPPEQESFFYPVQRLFISIRERRRIVLSAGNVTDTDCIK